MNSVIPLHKFTAELHKVYRSVRNDIEERLESFSHIGENGSEMEIFHELVFCLLTPQSSARRCGRALEILKKRDLILCGCLEDISDVLNIVRFRNNKARYILRAREMFIDNGKASIKKHIPAGGDPHAIRQWLSTTVLGMGYKEASHFLRNIGRGNRLAILDRHILKNLAACGVISHLPKSMNPGLYLSIENHMMEFSENISIPMAHLDLVFWYMETGDIYK